MVYHDNMVAVVKSGGQILREVSGDDGKVVFLPFGSEYSILLKNLHSRKALVRVFIDGQEVSPFSGYVIDASCDAELERFYSSSNKFKFIQKTQEIVEHRGDRVDDGMIRVEFQYEKPKPINVDITYSYHNNYYCYDYCRGCCHYRPWKKCSPCWGPTLLRSSQGYDSNTVMYNSPECTVKGGFAPTAMAGGGTSSASVNYVNTSTPPSVPDIQQDEGITVKGSQSNQTFGSAYIGDLEPNKEVIVIRLRGRAGEVKQVTQPITVRTKTTCETCGKTWDAGTRFCANCGTSLEIF
jgi:hypothetical protein